MAHTQNDQINFGAGAQLTPEQQQSFQRKGKRRNCFFVPGSSNPHIAKNFSDSLYKQCFGSKQENQNCQAENPQE